MNKQDAPNGAKKIYGDCLCYKQDAPNGAKNPFGIGIHP